MNTDWNPYFSRCSPAFDSLNAIDNGYWQAFNQWPSLQHYNDLLHPLAIKNLNEKLISFAEPGEKNYEERIFVSGKINTREKNWHDFFNMLAWFNFPLSKARFNYWQCTNTVIPAKAKINYLHYNCHPGPGAKRRRAGIQEKNTVTRSALQNRITHLDESGCIILCSDTKLIGSLKNHQWHELFWQQRESVKKYFRVFIIGHGVLEKLLNPYVGLTSPGIIFPVDELFFSRNLYEQRMTADKLLADFLQDKNALINLNRLTPMPLLGIPSWFEENEKEEFYFNNKYFRPIS